MSEDKKGREELRELAETIEREAKKQGLSTDEYIVNLVKKLRAKQKKVLNQEKGKDCATENR